MPLAGSRGQGGGGVGTVALFNPLECPICLRQMVDPRLTPCNHTFCHACIDGLRNAALRNHAISLKCPICRTYYSVYYAHGKNYAIQSCVDSFGMQVPNAPKAGMQDVTPPKAFVPLPVRHTPKAKAAVPVPKPKPQFLAKPRPFAVIHVGSTPPKASNGGAAARASPGSDPESDFLQRWTPRKPPPLTTPGAKKPKISTDRDAKMAAWTIAAAKTRSPGTARPAIVAASAVPPAPSVGPISPPRISNSSAALAGPLPRFR